MERGLKAVTPFGRAAARDYSLPPEIFFLDDFIFLAQIPDTWDFCYL